MANILVGDDHSLFLEGVESLLLDEPGIDSVHVATDGKEVLEKLSQHKIDVVLLDIQMPVMDGIDTAKHIMAKYPDVKVIMLTMFDKTVMIEKLIEIGVHGYLLKNSHKDELLRAIKTVLDGELFYSSEITKKIVMQKKQERSKPLKLTNREKEIVELISTGLTTAQISDKLFISKNTVDSHRKNILSKTDCKNATQLINWARENDLIM